MLQVKTVHASYSMKRDDPDGLPHFVVIQFFMHLRFETYQNTFKYSQMTSNQLGTLRRLRKLLQLAETSILVYLMKLFKLNLLDYLKYHKKYSPKTRNTLVVSSNGLRSSKSILGATHILIIHT